MLRKRLATSTNTTTTSTTNKYSYKQIAINDVLNHRLTLTESSKRYNIPLSTLCNYIKIARQSLQNDNKKPNDNNNDTTKTNNTQKLQSTSSYSFKTTLNLKSTHDSHNNLNTNKRKQNGFSNISVKKRKQQTNNNHSNSFKSIITNADLNTNGNLNINSNNNGKQSNGNFKLNSDAAPTRIEFDEIFKLFEKTLQIYAFLGLRHKYHPIFLNRNLSYMSKAYKIKSKQQKSNGSKKKQSIDSICAQLAKNKSCELKQSPSKRKSLLKLNNSSPSINNHNTSNSNNEHEQRKMQITYQFIGKENVKLTVKLDSYKPYNCPFCGINCKMIEPLIKHFSYNHFRFSIESLPSQITQSTNKVQINVYINDRFDGSYCGSQYDLQSANGISLSRLMPTKRVSITNMIFCKKKKLYFSNDANDITDTNFIRSNAVYNLHNLEKLYYHTRTCLPIKPNELIYNAVDSDSELDPEWLKEQTEMFIQDFADVNQGEKEIMRLWNLHILRNNFISDTQLFNACETFIEAKGEYLLENNLTKNFFLHLANLYDYGLLNANHITKLSDLLYLKQYEQKVQSLLNK